MARRPPRGQDTHRVEATAAHAALLKARAAPRDPRAPKGAQVRRAQAHQGLGAVTAAAWLDGGSSCRCQTWEGGEAVLHSRLRGPRGTLLTRLLGASTWAPHAGKAGGDPPCPSPRRPGRRGARCGRQWEGRRWAARPPGSTRGTRNEAPRPDPTSHGCPGASESSAHRAVPWPGDTASGGDLSGSPVTHVYCRRVQDKFATKPD